MTAHFATCRLHWSPEDEVSTVGHALLTHRQGALYSQQSTDLVSDPSACTSTEHQSIHSATRGFQDQYRVPFLTFLLKPEPWAE